MGGNNSTGSGRSPATMRLLLALALSACLLAPSEARKHDQHQQQQQNHQRARITWNLLLGQHHRTDTSSSNLPVYHQQPTEAAHTFGAPTATTTTTTKSATTRAGHHLIKRRHANDGPTQQLADDTGGGRNNNNTAQTNDDEDINNNNSTDKGQEVQELSAFEAASLGYFRHSLDTSVILTMAYTLVFIVGLIGNSFVVAIVCKSPRMRTVTNYFIANLALADILVLLFCLPANLVGNLFVPYVLGLFVCKTVSYLQGVAVSASINTMVAVTLDRFLAICFPMDWHMSRRMARWTIACIWLFSMSVSLPWALFFTLVPYPMHDNRTIQVCAEEWPSERMGSVYFVCANLILLYLFPATVIILCYLGIWYKIERRNIPGDRPKGLKIELIMQKSKLKVVKMMMVVVVIFLLSWLPLYLMWARIKLGDTLSPWEETLLGKMMPLAQWLGSSNSCINPVLYTFFNRKYKRGFIDLLKLSCCCGGCRSKQPLQLQHRPDAHSNGQPTSTHCTSATACRLATGCTGCRQQTRAIADGQHPQNGPTSEGNRSTSRCCRQQPDMRMDFILPAVSGRRLNQNGARRHLANRQHCKTSRSSTTTTTMVRTNSSTNTPTTGAAAAANTATTTAAAAANQSRTQGATAGQEDQSVACEAIEMKPTCSTRSSGGRRRHSGSHQQQHQKPQTEQELMLAGKTNCSGNATGDGRPGSRGRLHRSSQELGELRAQGFRQKARASAPLARQTPDGGANLKGRRAHNSASECSATRGPINRVPPPASTEAKQQGSAEGTYTEFGGASLRGRPKAANQSRGGEASRCKRVSESKTRPRRRRRNVLSGKNGTNTKDRSLISSAKETTESTDATGLSVSTVASNTDNNREATVYPDMGRPTSGERRLAHSGRPKCTGDSSQSDDCPAGACGRGVRDNLGQSGPDRSQTNDTERGHDDDDDDNSEASASLASLPTSIEDDEDDGDRCTNGDDDDDEEEDDDDDDDDEQEDENEDDDDEDEEDNLLFGSASSEEDQPAGDKRQRLSLGSCGRPSNIVAGGEHIGRGLAASGNSFVELIMNGLSSLVGANSGPSSGQMADPRRHSATTTIDGQQPKGTPINCTSGSQRLDCKTSIIKNCASTTTLTGTDNNNNININNSATSSGGSKQADYNV